MHIIHENCSLPRSNKPEHTLRARSRIAGGIILAVSSLVLSPAIPVYSGESIRVELGPNEAIGAGAQWRFGTDAVWRDSGVTYSNLLSGTYSIEFKPLPGWYSPKPPPSGRWQIAVRNEPGNEVVHGIAASYRPVALFTLRVGASGGTIGAWPLPEPAVFDALRISSTNDAQWNLAKGRSLRPRDYPLTEADILMPTNNAGYGVQLFAIPDPGYQFAGWIGDMNGTLNPITLLLVTNRSLSAVFRPVPFGGVTATLLAENYTSPGRVVVHAQFSYPTTNSLLTLTWRPLLPPGWEIEFVNGLGAPRFENGAVQFSSTERNGLSTNLNPVQFNFTIRVPAGETVPRQISSEVEYTFAEIPLTGKSRTEPITINAEHALAVLELNVGNVPRLPPLRISGQVGDVITIQFTEPATPGPFEHWRFWDNVILTNSAQTWHAPVDSSPHPSRYYRAVRIQ